MATILDHTSLMEQYNPYRSQSDVRQFGQQQAHHSYNRTTNETPSGNHLPSFSEILPDHVRTEQDCVSTPQPLITAEPEFSTTAGQPVTFDSRPGLAFSEHIPLLSMPDSFDDYHRGQNPHYHTQNHSRHSASWSTSPHHGEMTPTYNTQHRNNYQGQNTSYTRHNSGLPPIRDIDPRSERVTAREPTFMSPNGQYGQDYGLPQSNSNVQTNVSYPSRTALYYDTNPRYNQPYQPSNRPYSQPVSEFSRFGQHPVDAYRQPSNFAGPYTGSNYGLPSVHGIEPSVYGSSTESADTRNRRRRGNLPKSITEILRTWFLDHLDHPYPTEEDKQTFVNQTGLSMNQISNWFINARRRQLPALRHARNQGTDNVSADRDSGPSSQSR